jgi:hypothetical protein
VRGQVLHPHKTTGKIIVPYCFYIYVFGQQTGRQKLLDWIVAGVPWIHLLSVSSQMQFLFASVVHKHFNFATLSKDLVPIFRLWFYSATVHEMWHIMRCDMRRDISWDVTYHFLFICLYYSNMTFAYSLLKKTYSILCVNILKLTEPGL